MIPNSRHWHSVMVASREKFACSRGNQTLADDGHRRIRNAGRVDACFLIDRSASHMAVGNPLLGQNIRQSGKRPLEHF